MIDQLVYSWEIIRSYVLANWANPEVFANTAFFYCIFVCSFMLPSTTCCMVLASYDL